MTKREARPGKAKKANGNSKSHGQGAPATKAKKAEESTRKGEGEAHTHTVVTCEQTTTMDQEEAEAGHTRLANEAEATSVTTRPEEGEEEAAHEANTPDAEITEEEERTTVTVARHNAIIAADTTRGYATTSAPTNGAHTRMSTDTEAGEKAKHTGPSNRLTRRFNTGQMSRRWQKRPEANGI